MAMALKRLHHFTVHRHRKGEMIGSMQAAQALAESLGEEIDRVINSDDIGTAARKFGNRVAECVKALAREQGRLPDLRTKKDRIPAAGHADFGGAGAVYGPCREAPKGGAYILDGVARISPSRKRPSGILERHFS